MEIREAKAGKWEVVNNSGAVIATFATNSAAWRFVDRREVHPTHLSAATADRLDRYDVS